MTEKEKNTLKSAQEDHEINTKEELEKKEDNVFTLAFTKCDVKSESSDFNIDCHYSIWDNQTKTFYVKGRLGPYTNVTKGGIPSLMADHLVIALGLD